VACVLRAVDENGSATIESFLVFGPLVIFWEPIFLDARVDAPPNPPTGRDAPEPRMRFLITSVFKESGRTIPWSFRKSPQALQRGCPSAFRRHRGVVCVKQLVQVVGILS
jgi:hypothetical protein